MLYGMHKKGLSNNDVTPWYVRNTMKLGFNWILIYYIYVERIKKTKQQCTYLMAEIDLPYLTRILKWGDEVFLYKHWVSWI